MNPARLSRTSIVVAALRAFGARETDAMVSVLKSISANRRDVLFKAGYNASAKTFFIWEGVSFYLTETAVRETLRTISRAAIAGSSLVMDFAGAALIEMLGKFPGLPQHKYTKNWDEPWIFIWMFLTRRSQWYALARLEVPVRAV